MGKKEEDPFEEYWKANRAELLRRDKEYARVAGGYKMESGADWLLFAMPAVAAVAVMNHAPFQSELANWLLAAAAAVVVFAACVAVKSAVGGIRPASEVEREAKERCRREFHAGKGK